MHHSLIPARPSTPKIYLKKLGDTIPQESIHGVLMGFLKVSPSAAKLITAILEELLANPDNRKAAISRLLQELLKRQYPVRVPLHGRALARHQQLRGCGPGRGFLVCLVILVCLVLCWASSA